MNHTYVVSKCANDEHAGDSKMSMHGLHERSAQSTGENSREEAGFPSLRCEGVRKAKEVSFDLDLKGRV